MNRGANATPDPVTHMLRALPVPDLAHGEESTVLGIGSRGGLGEKNVSIENVSKLRVPHRSPERSAELEDGRVPGRVRAGPAFKIPRTGNAKANHPRKNRFFCNEVSASLADAGVGGGGASFA